MEQKDSDVEMEVDGAGTFSQDEGEMQCGEESHQMQKEHNRNINDDSRNRSKIDNRCVDEYLSNTFMKLSVKDGLSASPAEYDISRQVNCTADGSHSKVTIPTSNFSSKHDKNLKVLQDEPNDIMSGNFKTRSSVNVDMNDTNNMSLPYNTTAVDRKKQKQVMNINTIEMSGAESYCSNTVRKDIDIDGVLQKQKMIENVCITYVKDVCLNIISGEKNIKCLPHDARIDRSILFLSLPVSENSKAEGCYGNDHLTSFSLPVKLTGDIHNSLSRDLSSPPKEVVYGTDNGKEDLTSPQKVIGNGVSSLQRDTSLTLTEKVLRDSDFRKSLQSDTSSALAEKNHSINSLQSSKLSELGKKINGVKDHTVNSLKDYSSSTLKEKENCVGSLCTNLSPTLQGKGQAVNSLYPDLSSTVMEKGLGRDSRYADSSLTPKGRKLHREVLNHEKNENVVVEVHEKEIKHERPYHCEEEKYRLTNDNKILQKQNNSKADVRRVYETDFSDINRPHEDRIPLEGLNSFDTFDHARLNHRKSYLTREERIHNSTLDCNLDNELRQSCRKIGSQRKSKKEDEWEIRMSHSNNGFDKRQDMQTKYKENYHQRINYIHVGKTQPSGSESSEDDTDEFLHIEKNKDKFASIHNSAIIDIVYRKISWKSYLEINQHIGEWDCDCMDPFEQSLSRCTFGTQKRKMFYRDFDAHAHHDSGDIRGWNKGEFIFIGEISPVTKEKVESFIEKGEGELTPEGGAIRKTNEKNTDIKRGEQRILQRSKSNAESNMEYGRCTESMERNFYGLPPDLITEDETDSSDELQDKVCGMKKELQRQSQHQGYCSVWTRESPAITDEAKTVESSGVQSSLVKYLTRCKDFSSDMAMILSKFSLFENVKKFFEEHPDVFSISGNIVELRPKISLCEDFLSSYGCKNRLSCTKLHICDGFIVNICNDSNCIYGHNICTTHNKKALQSFWMESLDASTIIEALRLSMLGAVNFQSLDICYDYNFSSCQNYNCKALHICIDYVGGLGLCIRPDCTLNHNIQTQNCIDLLSSYGIDITRLGEEEKLLKVIQESYEITRFVQGYESKARKSIDFQLGNQQQRSSPYSKVGSIQKQKLNSVKLSESLQTNRNLINPSETMRNPGAIMHSKPVHTTMNASSIVTPSHLKNMPSSSQDNYSKGFLLNGKSRTHAEGENGSQNFISELPLKIKSAIANFSSTKDKVNPKNQKNGTKFSTVWSNYPIGDVDIAEICYYSLNTVCKFESSGCQRLHAPMEFHWQMKVSLNVSWINLQSHQVFHLEQFYMDPSTEISKLPSPCSEEHPKIVHQILKDEKHYVNFTKLQLINAITFEIYELRRLHVQAKGKSDSFDVFLWYFKDIAGKWILYGNVDSSGDRHSATKIRSHDIEKKYLCNEAKFHFKNITGNSSYMLDFEKMVQVNRDTGSIREVRRRPKPTISP